MGYAAFLGFRDHANRLSLRDPCGGRRYPRVPQRTCLQSYAAQRKIIKWWGSRVAPLIGYAPSTKIRLPVGRDATTNRLSLPEKRPSCSKHVTVCTRGITRG